MKCSVCIPTYHRPENLNMVLASILAMKDDRIDEVIVGITGAEADSINDTTLQLREAYGLAGMSLITVAGCSGICGAKTLFKHMAKNEVMLFCDDDGVFSREYLDLLDWFRFPDVGAVSGTLQTPINVIGYKDWSDKVLTLPNSVKTCNTLKIDEETGAMDWSDKYQVYMVQNEDEQHRIYRCQYLIGTCLFVRKSALEIDMNFEKGACAGEEIDFTHNMYRKGYDLLFDSSRMAFHMHSMVGGNRKADRKLDDVNMTYLVQKWGLGDKVSGETVYGGKRDE